MKRFYLLLLAAAVPAGAGFSLTAGAGVLTGMDITRYTLHGEGDRHITDFKVSTDAKQEMTQFDFGAFLFAEETYVMFSFAAQGGLNSFWEETAFETSATTPLEPSVLKGEGQEMSLGFSLLGKYPFVVKKFTVFPLAGLEYRIVLINRRRVPGGNWHSRDKGYFNAEMDSKGKPYPLSAWNSLWIVLGAGGEMALSRSWYLNAALLYGFRLQTDYETKALQRLKDELNDDNPSLGGLTSAPTLRVAIGWRFF